MWPYVSCFIMTCTKWLHCTTAWGVTNTISMHDVFVVYFMTMLFSLFLCPNKMLKFLFSSFNFLFGCFSKLFYPNWHGLNCTVSPLLCTDYSSSSCFYCFLVNLTCFFLSRFEGFCTFFTNICTCVTSFFISSNEKILCPIDYIVDMRILCFYSSNRLICCTP